MRASACASCSPSMVAPRCCSVETAPITGLVVAPRYCMRASACAPCSPSMVGTRCYSVETARASGLVVARRCSSAETAPIAITDLMVAPR